jgi:predicted metalloprotease with PDZ domain
MTAPRHLWSGDWRRESAEAAEAIADRVGPTDTPAEPPSPARPSALARALSAVRDADYRPVRRAALITVAALLSAGVAYAAVAALVTTGPHAASGGQPPSGVVGGPAWLGVDTVNFPLTGGAMIVDVAPGGPADAAGLQPGDVITEIDNRLVRTPADLQSTLAGLHAGQQAQIGYQQGPSPYSTSGIYTTKVTLRARP